MSIRSFVQGAAEFLCLVVLFLTPSCASSPATDLTSIRLATLSTPPANFMALLTDTSGTVTNIKEFRVFVESEGKDLSFRRYGGFSTDEDDIYRYPRSIPIRQGDIVTFIYLDRISEYHLVGGRAILVLDTGERIAGAPLGECYFHDGFPFDEATAVQAQKVKTLKFNIVEVKQFAAAETADIATRDATFVNRYPWPTKFTLKADITLSSGKSLTLHNLALVYLEVGQDTSWSPSITYGRWKITDGKILYTYTATGAEINLSQIKTITFGSPAKWMPDDYPVKMEFQSGEQFSTKLGVQQGLAFLGTVPNGYAHVPFRAIKSVAISHE